MIQLITEEKSPPLIYLSQTYIQQTRVNVKKNGKKISFAVNKAHIK